MKKEVFLAVLVGFGLGLIITFGIWTANKNLNPMSKTPDQVVTPSPSAETPTDSADQNGVTLTITSPAEDELLLNTNKLTVSGKTQAGNTVAIVYETGQQLTVADSSGNFSADLNLEGGYNRLTIKAFDTAGNVAIKDILITYSSTKI